MNKIKLSEFIKKYADNKKIIDAAKADTEKERLELYKAKERQSHMVKSFFNQIHKEEGIEKTYEVLQEVYNYIEKKNPNFNAKDKIKAAKDKYNNLYKRFIPNTGFTNEPYPAKDKVQAINKRHGYTSSDKIKDLDKYLEECLKEGGQELKDYIEDNVTIGYAMDLGSIIPIFDEALSDPDFSYKPNDEISYDSYALDKTDEELSSTKNNDVIDNIMEMDIIKNNPENVELFKDLKVVGNVVKDEYNSVFDSYESAGDSSANAFIHTVEATTNIKDYDDMFEYKILDGKEYVDSVVKPGKERELQAFYDNDKIVLSARAKEGLKKAFAKFDEIKLPLGDHEEGNKIYAFSPLYTDKQNIIAKLESVRELDEAIRKKNEEIAAAKENAKAKLENEKAELEERKLATVGVIVALKKSYDQREKEIDSLGEIVNEYFGDTKHMNTNVDVVRNSHMTTKYRKDFITPSRINGIQQLYTFIKKQGISVDDFLNDPSKYVNEAIIKDVKNTNKYPTGEEETFTEEIENLIDISQVDKQFKARNEVGNGVTRGLEFLISTDDENLKKNSQSYFVLDKKQHHYNAIHSAKDILRDNAVKTFENIFASRDIKVSRLIADSFVTPITHKATYPSDYDPDKFINDDELSKVEMLNKLNIIMDVIDKKNQANLPGDEKEVESKKNQLANYVFKAFANTAVKYMQRNSIDPETTDDPQLKVIIKAIKEPNKFLKEDLGITDMDPKFDLKLERRNLKLLTKSEYKKTDEYKEIADLINNLEKDTIKEEKKFDKEAATFKKEMDNRIKKLLKDDPDDVDDLIREEQRKYQNYLINHCNSLYHKFENDEITESFYQNRIEQIYSGVPIGNLNFSNGTLKISEEVYIHDKIAKELPDEFDSEEERIRETEETTAEGKEEYKEMIERIKDGKEKLIDKIFRDRNRPFVGVETVSKIDDALDNYDVMSTIGDDDESELSKDEDEKSLNNSLIENEEKDLNGSLFEDEEDLNIINTNQKKKITVDLNEKKNDKKSSFISDDDSEIDLSKSNITK